MLQNIREGIQGPWAIGIVAVIVVSFVFTGVGSYITSSGTTAVAVVNGEEISAARLEISYENERARLENQFGEAINSLFESESYINQFRRDILDNLINEELVIQKAQSLGLRVGDDLIKDTIVQMPEFQQLGQFNNEVYQLTLQRAGYSPSQFAEYMRNQLTRQQLVTALNGSGFSLSHQINSILALQEQTRDAKAVEIIIDDYLQQVTVEQVDIQTFYDDNIADFDTQEKVKLAYVTLSVSDLKSRVDVSEEEVSTYYVENQASYTSDSVREIAHILFEIGDDSESTRRQAESVLQQLQNGADFATLAGEFSDDLLSAEEGGSLGVINEGDYSGAFEDAAFALSDIGNISDLVETEFGIHIIKLVDFTPEVVTPFSEVEADIKDNLLVSKATDEFYILQNEMARLAFEQPDSLDAVASAINKPIIETELFQANQLPAGINYPQVNDIAFSSELIDEGVNSEVLTVGNELVMVTRVAEHQPQRTMTLDEVQEEVEQNIRLEKAQSQALVFAQEVQNGLFSGEDVEALLATKGLAWTSYSGLGRRSNDLSASLVNELFALGTESTNNSAIVTLPSGNIGIVTLEAVNTASEPDEAVLVGVRQRVANTQSQQTADNFVEALRAEANIKIITQ